MRRGKPRSLVRHTAPVLNLVDIGTDTHFTHRYAKQVSLPVIHRAFGTRAVSYAMILQLDRFIQEYPIPPHLRVTEPGEPAPGATTEQIFQSLNILTSVRKRARS